MRRKLLPLYPLDVMNAAAPEGVSLCGGEVTKIQKNFLPAVPRRGPEAEVPRREDDFRGLSVNRIDSCLFLQSRFFFGCRNDPSEAVAGAYRSS